MSQYRGENAYERGTYNWGGHLVEDDYHYHMILHLQEIVGDDQIGFWTYGPVYGLTSEFR